MQVNDKADWYYFIVCPPGQGEGANINEFYACPTGEAEAMLKVTKKAGRPYQQDRPAK